MGFDPGDRIVQIDVDTIITGSLDSLFDRDDDFVIMQGGNASNPCPYNGAMWMQRAYTNEHIYSDFSLTAAAKIPYDSFPDDQGWFAHKLPNAAGWKCGRDTGVYVFRKPGWPSFVDASIGDDLPRGARLVTFSGRRTPEGFKHLDWVKRHWSAGD